MEFSPDQLEKIRSFKWADEEPEDGSECQPGSHFAGEVLECARRVAGFVMGAINIEKFDENRFSVPIPTSIHPLLSERYNAQWTNESRTSVFDIVKAACIVQIEDNQHLIEEKVQKIFPSKSSDEQMNMIREYVAKNEIETRWEVGTVPNKYKLAWVRMYDEPVVNSRVQVMQVEQLLSTKPEVVIELGVERVPIE